MSSVSKTGACAALPATVEENSNKPKDSGVQTLRPNELLQELGVNLNPEAEESKEGDVQPKKFSLKQLAEVFFEKRRRARDKKSEDASNKKRSRSVGARPRTGSSAAADKIFREKVLPFNKYLKG